MSNVKIYTAVSEDLSPLIQGEGFCVDMVRYSDYAALESRCTAKDEKLRMINELIDAAEQVNKLAQEATERLIQERDALAAENAGLKDFLHSRVDESICDKHIKTPATESFLAEVRAQGVEMAACALDDVNQFNYANMLDDLAQKIRQDASTADLVADGIGVKEQ